MSSDNYITIHKIAYIRINGNLVFVENSHEYLIADQSASEDAQRLPDYGSRIYPSFEKAFDSSHAQDCEYGVSRGTDVIFDVDNCRVSLAE